MSLFNGKKQLKHQYAEVAWDDADFVAGIDNETAKLIMVLQGIAYKLFIDNALDAEVQIFVEHPDAFKEVGYDPGDYRLLLTKISGGQTLNYSVGESPQIQFDPGTKIYAIQSTVSTSGKFKLSAW
ncbi:MAG: hypothetical protein QXL01_00360 [Thermoplasmatales archaeon]